MGTEGSEKPGMFVSFEKLLTDLSGKMDAMQQAVLDEIGKVRQEIATKASKEHVDAVEARWKAAHDALARIVDKQGEEIIELRVGEGTAKGVSKTSIAFIVAGVGLLGAILSALIYAALAAHGGP